MSKNYMRIISSEYSEAEVVCSGDASVYSNITWLTAQIPKSTLDTDYIKTLKDIRIEDIDTKTEELISSGFTYDGSLFSMSAGAQTNWIALNQANSMGLISFPYKVTTKDDSSYTLTDSNELTSFYATGLGTKSYHLDSGRTLKESVNQATTEGEINAIIDNR